jgi:hypothetical protein
MHLEARFEWVVTLLLMPGREAEGTPNSTRSTAPAI